MSKGLAARYPHGELPLPDHVAFLTQYCAARPPGPFTPPDNKSEKRGEIFHLRDAIRTAHPGWHCTVQSIRAALGSKAEWAAWQAEMFGERQEKLEARREAKGRDRTTGRKVTVDNAKPTHKPPHAHPECVFINTKHFRALLMERQLDEADNAVAEMLADRQGIDSGEAGRRHQRTEAEATHESMVMVTIPGRDSTIVMQRTIVRLA